MALYHLAFHTVHSSAVDPWARLSAAHCSRIDHHPAAALVVVCILLLPVVDILPWAALAAHTALVEAADGGTDLDAGAGSWQCRTEDCWDQTLVADVDQDKP